MEKSQIGVIGLAVMGANLARNFSNHGTRTLVYNRTTSKMQDFIAEFGCETLSGAESLEEFVAGLERPRRMILMVKAGAAVDAVIEQLTPLLEEGDIIMDGGNSHYKDTQRREEALSEKGIYLVGMGISGGEEGALNGPSIMPGGAEEAYQAIEPIVSKSAADDGLGGKCFTHIGPDGSGHFVKMVHNGIEYAIMQLIAESYDILKNIGGLTNEELAETFDEWKKTKFLKSFLVEITATIFKKIDPETGKHLIDFIKDSAKQKGTGKWTTFAALDYGSPTPTINASVDCRIISGDKEKREIGKEISKNPVEGITIPEKIKLIEIVKNALIASTILAYDQGLTLLEKANREYEWNLDLSEIARIWRGGCIIRSDYLAILQDAYNPDSRNNQMSAQEIRRILSGPAQSDLRKTLSLAISSGIPTAAMSSAMAYLDSASQPRLPQNLTQAQRDLFGAHTYERTDKEGTFHTEWESIHSSAIV